MASTPYSNVALPGTPAFDANESLIYGQNALQQKQAAGPGYYNQYGNWSTGPDPMQPVSTYGSGSGVYDNTAKDQVGTDLTRFAALVPTAAGNILNANKPPTPTGNGQPFSVGNTQAQWIPQMGFYSTDPQMQQLSTQDTAGGGNSAPSPYALSGATTDALINARNASHQGGAAVQNPLKLGGYMYDPHNMPQGAYTPGFTPTAAQTQQYGIQQATAPGTSPYGPVASDLQYMPASAGGAIQPPPATSTGGTTGGGFSMSGMLPFSTFNGIDPQMLQQQIAHDQGSIAQQAGANSRDLANQYSSSGFSTRGPGFTAQTALDAAKQAMANESIGSTDRLNAMNYNAQGSLANNQANYGYQNNLQQNANTRYGIDQNSQLGALGAVIGMLK